MLGQTGQVVTTQIRSEWEDVRDCHRDRIHDAPNRPYIKVSAQVIVGKVGHTICRTGHVQ